MKELLLCLLILPITLVGLVMGFVGTAFYVGWSAGADVVERFVDRRLAEKKGAR